MNPNPSSTRRSFLRATAAGAAGFAARRAGGVLPLATVPAAVVPPGRRVRIATVCQAGRFRPTVAENRDYVMSLLDEACRSQPDLVCLPEAFSTVNSRLSLLQKSEPVDGPTVMAAAVRAREHRCYVVCPLATYRDGVHYNSAVILDRSGRLAGIYDKACPVTSSADYRTLEDGIMPGAAEVPVFDLDFGRIGIQICFDVGFPEQWQRLRDLGAQLVLWPSAYDGGTPLWSYAWHHHYYVVSSVRTGQSRIIDPCGAVLRETTSAQQVIIRDLSLDYVVAHFDFNYGVAGRIKAKYGDRVDVRRSLPGANHFLVESMDPAITCRQLQDEFGFESTWQYHERHRVAYRALRAGHSPPPQTALHGNRPQYGSA